MSRDVSSVCMNCGMGSTDPDWGVVTDGHNGDGCYGNGGWSHTLPAEDVRRAEANGLVLNDGQWFE